MKRQSLVVKALVLGGCYLLFVMQTLATCNDGLPVMKMSTCPCTDSPWESTVCMGIESSSCDPLGGALRNCGGSCYKIPATPCGGITMMQPIEQAKPVPVVAHLATDTESPCGASSRPTSEKTLAAMAAAQKAQSEFNSWLNKNLTRGK